VPEPLTAAHPVCGTGAIASGSPKSEARISDLDSGTSFASLHWTNGLLVSLAMLVLLPVHQHGLIPWLAPGSESARLHFSHAYFGAVRHAITVGFISLMIVGVAAKVVPTLNGLDVRRLSPLWAPFLLLNAGCSLRVTGQTLTDFVPQALPVTGASGVLEVLGLALWGAHLWRIMAGRLQRLPQRGEDRTALRGADGRGSRYPGTPPAYPLGRRRTAGGHRRVPG
jgi:hypothetical protein